MIIFLVKKNPNPNVLSPIALISPIIFFTIDNSFFLGYTQSLTLTLSHPCCLSLIPPPLGLSVTPPLHPLTHTSSHSYISLTPFLALSIVHPPHYSVAHPHLLFLTLSLPLTHSLIHSPLTLNSFCTPPSTQSVSPSLHPHSIFSFLSFLPQPHLRHICRYPLLSNERERALVYSFSNSCEISSHQSSVRPPTLQ